MKLNPANPTTIKQIFSETYIIPAFQRPYSWEKAMCDKLFTDITDAFERDQTNPYYLGNVVTYKEGDENYVIDGQQRLTTLMLFAKALLECAGTFKDLENMLRVCDPKTGGLSDELKIESRVIDEDFNVLKQIIVKGESSTNNHKLVKNYDFLSEQIKNWRATHNTTDELDNFIKYFLEKVVLLPIKCDSKDDALIIFNTLNDRGLVLTDADVFKGTIYSQITTESDKKEFIESWNELNKYEKINSLFRDYMHLLRAQSGDIKKEKSLRDFFDKKLTDWKTIINDLKLLNVNEGVYGGDIDTNKCSTADNLWRVLECLPHDYCLYPAKIFWYKNAKINDDGKSEFIGDIEKLIDLLKTTIRFYYVFAVAHPGVNYIKDKTFSTESELYKQNMDITKILDYSVYSDTFKQMIEKNDYSNPNCKWGLVYLMSVLDKNQNQTDLLNIQKPELEHILPQNGGYNGAAGWTQNEYDENINGFGNLCICEKAINIKASNNFFTRKQTEYAKSKVHFLLDLSNSEQKWTFSDYKVRDKIMKDELFKFFGI